MPGKKKLRKEEQQSLLDILKQRFESHMHRHEKLKWSAVLQRLDSKPDKLAVLAEMERTGGEPDVIGKDKSTGEILFYDCSKESPKGRRSLCYDREALNARKQHKPKDSAMDVATAIGIEMLTEEQYRELQQLGEFDLKTSSWVRTPDRIREKGGATFCDRRYDTVFFYHNGAESYYAARGFRGCLRV
ncbi:DUF4256 domain-containing protein [bacterium]|nr:DUF4256 domain-containing protein [bacterium]